MRRVIGAVVVLGLLAGCSSQSSAGSTSVPPPAAPSSAADHTDCFARPPARGDVILWVKPSGQPASAQEIGGGWAWNYRTNECEDSVQWNLSANPDGGCTKAALAADNPSYNVDSDSPADLRKVIAEVGDC